MRSGIRNHQQQSSDPSCKKPLCIPLHEPEESDVTMDNNDRMDDLDFGVDPRGDFFGDYEDYVEDDVEDDSEGDGYEENQAHDGDDEDDNLEDGEDIDEPFLEPDLLPNPAMTASEDGEDIDEPSLEPERLPNPVAVMTASSDNDEVSGSATQRANRLRGGAEVELKNKPYIVKFKKGKAGAVYTNLGCVDENTAYTLQIGNQDNIFSPFSSKIEWEIALWAKTRGPSSTAFTELMSIEGVCGINIHMSRSD